ncbi:hypothetical protein LLS47_22150 [Rouxiella badensis]|uniref:Uncharacterized protein n=3 Tax=Rahnella TaxID=34037 RepID=A0ABS6KWJ4_9GAMM|nr:MULTISPECIES: hypothetical protein [Yersiniaceae]MBU9833400.1 hypothetical protein [Rahnella perminowiae]MBU9859331.1 hypothetical protein [Rahnella aceris]MCC3705628.1 hypothetical protein [Rouxiella badensis]MCC3735632.1 hypothetical protein [Rouxiella badensis]MCC3760914.1 hypothetical protein [Rouxiella badensis]
MSKNSPSFNSSNKTSDWMTIREAVKIANRTMNGKIKDSDIYRHALHGNIRLSIYFQSPIILKKVRTINHKIKLHPIDNMLLSRISTLEKNCFLSGRNLIISTKEDYIFPTQRVIDTTLSGHEYVLVQRLLAHSLGIPLPLTGANDINYGLSVIISGEILQLFEKLTWRERIKQQAAKLAGSFSLDIENNIFPQRINLLNQRGHFPLHDLPQDACFVIRYAELEKLINMPVKNGSFPPTSTRISTPLSRMFWLACKHNETISPLIRQPYKLLSIFEQWASAEGITDRLSGDTLKTALERGSPSSTSP